VIETLEVDFSDAPPSFQMRPYQVECIDAVQAGWLEASRQLVVVAGGCGKCLGRDTPVLMFDGTIKAVQDVEVGEVLIGPDFGPRRVLSVCRGREALYCIRQSDADSYVVNESHILSLKTRRRRTENISLRRYLALPEERKAELFGWKPMLRSMTLSAITVTPIGPGDYYGFEIDGPDRLFLLGDFTVTHNTVIFSRLASDEVQRGGRVLILAHTDELLEQAIDKLRRSTGLDADKEKADDHASPFATVVVASIQTLARESRLLGFADNHFTLVICDEAHRSLAKSYLRVMNYFHFGAESLAPEWVAPEPGMPYEHKARVLGVTATASRGDKRSLGEFYQRIAYEYDLLQAVRDGFLVRPFVKNIPLKIDIKGVRISRSSAGADFDLQEITARIAPIIREVAKQLAAHARRLKTVVFTPSVETARMLSEALKDEGMAASYVSGACVDRDFKIDDFRSAGPGSVLCNALLVVEGFDVPDISAVCILRPTKIWSFFVQASVRGTRILPGVIDGLATREERLAAIAASAKPFFTILDFLWITDRMDLVQPVDIVASRPEVREAMLKSANPDIVEASREAERDLLKSLEKAAKKHARKAARTIDPLAMAVSLGDAALATYEPESEWERAAPTPGQAEFIRRHGMNPDLVKYKGLASKIINRIVTRLKLHLATVGQLDFLHKLGVSEETAATLTSREASELIDRLKRKT
jgi:superfamily II DNA or RNA helicase